MKRLICFGDSITANERSKDGSLRLTPRLQNALKGWEIRNAGISGHNTRDAIARLNDDVLSYHPDLVTVLFGANDAASHKLVELEEYRSNLLQIVTSITPQKTVLITPSPVDESKPMNRTNIVLKRYAEVAEDIAHLTGSQFIDLFSHMISYPDYPRFLSDGLHFTEPGYALFANLLIENVNWN